VVEGIAGNKNPWGYIADCGNQENSKEILTKAGIKFKEVLGGKKKGPGD